MTDATDQEIARREHNREMGGGDATDRAWTSFFIGCTNALILRGYGTSLDGDEKTDGYSIDSAYDAFRLGHTVAEYMEVVTADRHELGLSTVDVPPAHDDFLDWPNGLGFTPCSTKYRQYFDEREAICPSSGNVDNLSREDYERWHALDMYLGTLQLQGHVGQGERI